MPDVTQITNTHIINKNVSVFFMVGVRSIVHRPEYTTNYPPQEKGFSRS
jgi:hypothetical protein